MIIAQSSALLFGTSLQHNGAQMRHCLEWSLVFRTHHLYGDVWRMKVRVSIVPWQAVAWLSSDRVRDIFATIIGRRKCMHKCAFTLALYMYAIILTDRLLQRLLLHAFDTTLALSNSPSVLAVWNIAAVASKNKIFFHGVPIGLPLFLSVNRLIYLPMSNCKHLRLSTI
jgi:hypothetical protein